MNWDAFPVVGAGGYGIVVQHDTTRVTKLFRYEALSNTHSVNDEAILQIAARSVILQYVPEVVVPKVWDVRQTTQTYRSVSYLSGIEMDFLSPPSDFDEQVHILLGYHGDDIDESWGVNTGKPVSLSNPTRGYFASPHTLEDIWKEEVSVMTVEKLAEIMGKTCRCLLDHNILPIDLEWVWSGGKPCLIDFGMCSFGKKDPYVFLETQGLVGLASDFYIPHKGDRGYEEFIEGFSQST
jgi:hypothetical protein